MELHELCYVWNKIIIVFRMTSMEIVAGVIFLTNSGYYLRGVFHICMKWKWKLFYCDKGTYRILEVWDFCFSEYRGLVMLQRWSPFLILLAQLFLLYGFFEVLGHAKTENMSLTICLCLQEESSLVHVYLYLLLLIIN